MVTKKGSPRTGFPLCGSLVPQPGSGVAPLGGAAGTLISIGPALIAAYPQVAYAGRHNFAASTAGVIPGRRAPRTGARSPRPARSGVDRQPVERPGIVVQHLRLGLL